MITCAKGLTNGAVPMGAVLASKKIHDAFMQGPPGTIELFHGYTYSGHPIACAAGLAALRIYEGEKLLTRARQTGPVFEKALHELRGLPHVIDIRNYGLVAGIELDPIAGSPGARAFGVYLKCFERGLLIRTTGDIIALSPALTIEPKHIEELFGVLAQVLKE
jgi:beta-alanine--pyruvate transaminase